MAVKKSNENSLRVFLKATTWRMVGTADTIFLSWLFTGQIASALKIGFTEVFTKIFLFYLHEKLLWSRLRFGQTYSPEGVLIAEKNYRSLIKGISWRFFGTIDTILIALFWTGDFKKAFAIGATEIITKVLLYWIHERVWLRVKWQNPLKLKEETQCEEETSNMHLVNPFEIKEPVLEEAK
ncbi:MAG: DUF2061 domain-containing protein [Bacteroidetes bacterium]|nr:DUF2061 domain-containing protein [Bacteroidota bacterium]